MVSLGFKWRGTVTGVPTALPEIPGARICLNVRRAASAVPRVLKAQVRLGLAGEVWGRRVAGLASAGGLNALRDKPNRPLGLVAGHVEVQVPACDSEPRLPRPGESR